MSAYKNTKGTGLFPLYWSHVAKVKDLDGFALYIEDPYSKLDNLIHTML